ncbi:hypothetical protein [Burkholderia glumae]|uniref:hypothetical protein n=1 Tax=Burkholderia glumae TaxID=337 RepID=UPI0021515860|nr:hypothetical protein [Burkholderia glumae]
MTKGIPVTDDEQAKIAALTEQLADKGINMKIDGPLIVYFDEATHCLLLEHRQPMEGLPTGVATRWVLTAEATQQLCRQLREIEEARGKPIGEGGPRETLQ